MQSGIDNYAFIDGNYLRKAYEAAMGRFFADVDYRNLSLVTLKQELQASKIFYYDSVDERLPDAKERLEYLDTLSSLDGFHVRRGTITGKKAKRRRQKKVDVQLAVDAMSHAFNKNCWHISLVAGDLDFEPLVNALIQLGVHVHVWHEKRSAAKGLHRAADVAAPITIDQFWAWSTPAFQRSNPIPGTVHGFEHNGEMARGTGTWRGGRIELYERPSANEFVMLARGDSYSRSFWVSFGDAARMKQYFELVHGPIAWDQDP